jgi:predicted MFS family arabinose efflux permease
VIRLALVTLFLLIALVVSNHTALLISCFVILLLIASGSQFFLPARVAVVADLVPPEQHPQAYGSLQQANYFAQILGPAVAAPLFIALGPVWAFSLNAFSFLVSCLLILLIHVPIQAKHELKEKVNFWRELKEGLRFFIGNRVLVTLLICGMVYMFGGMAYNSFEYLYGTENLHIPGELLGLYVGCYGVGVIIGLPIAAALAKRLSEVEVLWLFLIGSGITILVLSRVTSLIPGMICGLLFGFFGSSIFISVRPLTVLVTPRELIGRVMACEVPMITVASLAGGLIASTLASTVLADFHAVFVGMSFGRLDTIFVVVGMLTIGAGIFARLTLYKAVKAVRAQK